MTREAFEKLVREALKSLPKEIKAKLKNIDVVVQAGRPRSRTMGLYQGVSQDQRGEGYSMVLPDKITIFQLPVEAECRETGADIREELRHLVCHEIAHHFGISDERLRDLGVY